MSTTDRPAFLPPDTSLPPAFNRSTWGWSILLGLLTAALGSWVIGDFTHPLSDGNDTDQYEYVGYFFGKNIHFWPWPHLILLNTQTFYPYGTNQVFLDWGFERDYWYALCYRLFNGPGPYLQFYYVFSLVVTAVGTFGLLRPRFGVGKAFTAGLVVSVFNFYALYKFPVHLNVCVGHWTTLCIVATYRLLLDVLDKRPISFPYLLLWVWLHIQILGQELAYVAGYALTFSTLALLVLILRNPSGRPLPLKPGAIDDGVKCLPGKGPLKNEELPFYQLPHAEAWGYRGTWLLLFLFFLSAYLYLPLTLQIAFTAWQFDFGVVPELRSWSHPARLLIPHLPELNTYSVPSYQRWFHDTYESYGQGSPGLYLTLLAGIGWWQGRRRVVLWLPIVTMLVLCLLYHPVLLPTLKLFPWFSFNRHGGRASLVYPVLLCLLALPVRWPISRVERRLAVLMGLLMLSEWTYGFLTRTSTPTPVASDDVLRYCALIRQQPGVAVLDWPFCTVGADGVGAKEGLCPYYNRQNAVFTFRRFYDKSAVGQYFGRLHPDQIQPFLRDGWPRLLTPQRAFTKPDWLFLDHFLRRNHFAGINLYPDLLTPDQVAQFYRRYGRPIAETRLPAAGRVVFISLKPSQK